jgi:tetratricopeptide (TPR) repeat protein
MENKPEEAVPMLRAAVEQEPQRTELYMYLGVAYEQLGEYRQAMETYRRALSGAGQKAAPLHHNIGTNLLRMGELEKAVEHFTEALQADGNYAPAYLNRANTRVKLQQYEKAITDYQIYLSLRADSRQKGNIQRMIALLREKQELAEAQQLAEEQRRKEEERKRKELLDEVLSSLEESGEETKNLSAGTGEVKEYEDSFDIVD